MILVSYVLGCYGDRGNKKGDCHRSAEATKRRKRIAPHISEPVSHTLHQEGVIKSWQNRKRKTRAT
nr:MAG TPA: hypothetical protein [Caudoviricetes sp.]